VNPGVPFRWSINLPGVQMRMSTLEANTEEEEDSASMRCACSEANDWEPVAAAIYNTHRKGDTTTSGLVGLYLKVHGEWRNEAYFETGSFGDHLEGLSDLGDKIPGGEDDEGSKAGNDSFGEDLLASRNGKR
jgi:hypothetical protein